jgi:D-amino-acid dehydrogenase
VSAVPDVLVVGGGAIGVSCALELARRGADVTLLERGGDVAWGCSAGNAGLIALSHATPLANPAALREGVRWMWKGDSPFYLRPRPAVLPWLARFAAASTPERARASALVIRVLSRMSAALHRRLADEGLATGLSHNGSLNVYARDTDFEHGRREAAESAQHGVELRVLQGPEVSELEPAVAGSPAGAIFYPGDSHCDPLGYVQALAGAATDAGARIRTRVEVLGVRRRDGRVEGVATTAGELAAGTVVLAAGAWTPRLCRSLGVYVPVEGGKGYHLDVETRATDPAIPVWFHGTRVIATPLAGRLRLAGTLELAGLDLRIDRRRVEAIRAAAARGLVGLDGRRAVEVWRGLRPCSPDGLPIIGAPESVPGLVLATGHGMLGLTLAPVTGQLVAEVVAGEEPSVDLAPLRPERFQPILGRD